MKNTFAGGANSPLELELFLNFCSWNFRVSRAALHAAVLARVTAQRKYGFLEELELFKKCQSWNH
jgi:hypothetical protein